jgi:uracil-DNA glycosylase family 4
VPVLGVVPCRTSNTVVTTGGFDVFLRAMSQVNLLSLPMTSDRGLALLGAEIAGCRRCQRLVEWRERVAVDKRAAYRDEDYWGRPIAGFGDAQARIVVLGLAPAAHGANRTGRVFTGDRSGDFLFASMHRVGLANQPTSVSADDGLTLRDVWVTAAVKCAPPANKPLPAERDACARFVDREFELLDRVEVVVCLGAFGYEAACSHFRLRPRPALVLVPPQPAEHVHRPPDARDARRRVRARRRGGSRWCR